MKKLVLLLTVVLLAASESHAGLVQTFGVGANATSQGEAVAAHANDPFAVYYNPAGLTLIKKPVVTTGVMVYDAKVEITDFKLTSSKYPGQNFNTGPKDFESDCDPIINPTMGFAMPINDKWSFGIAAYAPYGLHLQWDKDYTKNPAALYAWESKFVRTVVTPAFGYKISDKLAVGVGVSLGKSISDAGKTYPPNPQMGPNPTHLALESEDDFNWSFNVGVMYRPIDQVSLGLTYRSRTDADFKGDVLMNGTKTGEVTMDYDHPECVQAGVRYFATKDLSVEFDMTWTRWGILDEQVENISSGQTFHHDRDWNNEIQYKIGLEWKLTDSFALRSGYTYDPTPVPNQTFDLGWPDTDRNVYNLGFGWDITDKWHLDGVVQHVRSSSVRNVRGDSNELNHVYGPIVQGGAAQVGLDVPPDTVGVHFGNEGILWGCGLSLSYTF
ncbi:MAG: long-chain fatty acid transporter [Desulfobacteraceae bacterium]|nr:long-chain fatty acid transporter [Desulfobacteraceae bacterium]